MRTKHSFLMTASCICTFAIISPAHAQYAQDCKEVLDIAGIMDQRMFSNSNLDVVTLSEFEEKMSSSDASSAAGKYYAIGGSYSRAESNARALRKSTFSRLNKSQLVDAAITRGDPNAISAWLSCRTNSGGPSQP